MNLLSQLQGVEGRDVVQRENSAAEILIETGYFFAKKYEERGNKNFPRFDDYSSDYWDEPMRLVYREMLQSFKKGRDLGSITFGEDDLKAVVYALADSCYEYGGLATLGIYTGCLLDILTRRNRRNQKKQLFYIDGNGRRFDFLFWGARNVDDLIVKDFAGNNICNSIASRKGRAGTVSVINCCGDWIAAGISSLRGHADLILSSSNEGDMCTMFAAFGEGQVNALVSSNNKGDAALNISAGDRGRIDKVIALGNSSIGLCDGSAENEGYIRALLADNNIGSSFSFCADNSGHIDLLAIINHKGGFWEATNYELSEEGKTCIDRLLIYNSKKGPGPSEFREVKEVIRGRKALKEFEMIKEQYSLDELGLLCSPIKGSDREQTIANVSRIKEITGAGR